MGGNSSSEQNIGNTHPQPRPSHANVRTDIDNTRPQPRPSHANVRTDSGNTHSQLRLSHVNVRLMTESLSDPQYNIHARISQPQQRTNSDYVNHPNHPNYGRVNHSRESQANRVRSNEPARENVLPPSKIFTKDEFMIKWFSWKDDFIKYMKSIDKEERNKRTWGNMLLNRMGPVGQEICKSFVFDHNQAKDNIDILFEKFDRYYIFFGTIKTGDNKEIEKYVNSLKIMATERAHVSDIDNAVKQKILEEIDKIKFTNEIKKFIPEFSFSSKIQSLSLKEITHIWMAYENVDYIKTEKIQNLLVQNCRNCADTHIVNECPARGKKCSKCKNENHFWMRCPSQYVINCSNCGEDHAIRRCHAYLNKCNKCDRQNHFSWKCSIRKINCNFCGKLHIASKSACPAVHAVCSKCHGTGHVASKCKRR